MSAAAPLFHTLLVANRGEIAVRVIRACHELGIRAVAVYSDADRDALHVRLADAALPIGPGPAPESYLRIEGIVAAALAAGAQAVHPGYGFLSESAAFAEACAAAGLVFVGPPPEAMRLLGDKSAARRLAASVGVSVVPGYDGADQRDETLRREADRIGYPLLVKAAAGGGGRGMRVVAAAEQLADALAAARREAGAAFGDDTLLLERLVEPARHVEVQVLGDRHGALVHLGERDCSVQRRHQKVIEESPAPAVSPELRARLGEAAVRVARAAGYQNAGTCEFLLDAAGRFWFIEMNARLQVEHPVTEMVTGLDLVRRQLEIAAGRPLGLEQTEIVLRGHAVECRLYAEDPARDDAPSTGRLTRFELPPGPGLRFDVGYASGDVVPPFYDSMLGKLIAFGEDRASALRRARAALDSFAVEGVATNVPLLAWVLDQPAFQTGQVTTRFLAECRPSFRPAPPTPAALAAAAVWELAHPSAPNRATSTPGAPPDHLAHWRLAGQGVILFLDAEAPDAGGRPRPAAVTADREGAGRWRVGVDGAVFVAALAGDRLILREDRSDAPARTCAVRRAADGLSVTVDGVTYQTRLAPPPDVDAPPPRRAAHGLTMLEAPMPGRVVRIAVAVGDRVREHQPLIVLEAMKIEHTVAAPRDGVVRALDCRVGETVAGGQLLVELAEA